MPSRRAPTRGTCVDRSPSQKDPRTERVQRPAPSCAWCTTPSFAYEHVTRNPGREGNAVVPSRKEAAAEAARIRAVGFELWSKARASRWGIQTWGLAVRFRARLFPDRFYLLIGPGSVHLVACAALFNTFPRATACREMAAPRLHVCGESTPSLACTIVIFPEKQSSRYGARDSRGNFSIFSETLHVV